MITHWNLNVEGMTCQGCARSVEKAVQSADPQALILVDLKAKLVSIKTHLPLIRIQEAIESAGFDVIGQTSASPSAPSKS